MAVKRREALRSSWLACYGVMAALVAPIAYSALTLGHDPIGWLAKPDWGAVPATFAQLAGDSFLHLGAVVACCLLAVRWAPRSARLGFGLAFTAAWGVLPVLAAFALSQVKPVFLAKYLIVCLPAVLLLAAGAVASLRPVGAALAAACILVALSGPELRAWYGFRGNEDWRSLTSFVLDRARPADAIVFNALYARDSVEDYSRSSKSPARRRFPATASTSSAAARTRVWLALAHSQPTTEALRSALMRHHRLEARQVFNGDIAVELYVRRKS